MKVLMLAPDCFMIDRRIVLEACSLIKAGHSVVLLAGFECAEEQHYMHRGIEIHRYKYDWDDEILKTIRNRLPHNDRLRMLVNRGYMFLAHRFFEISPFDRFILSKALEFDADIYHVHDLPCLKAGYYASKSKGVPLIYDAHELYYAQDVLTSRLQKIYFRLEKKYIKYPDAVITVNPFIARLMAERYGIEEPDVIMNCTELPEGFQKAGASEKLRKKGDIPLDHKVVLYQGWISPERNIDTLIKGGKWFPEDTCLAVIGYGEYEQTLHKIVKEEGLEGKVFFLGAVRSEEMLEYTAGADLGVIPYRPIDDNHRYCSPNKLFEYVLAGVPVVTDDLPFFRLMQADYGFVSLTDMGAPETFGKAVCDILSSPERIKDLRAKCKAASKELNWEVESWKLLKIYEKSMREKILAVDLGAYTRQQGHNKYCAMPGGKKMKKEEIDISFIATSQEKTERWDREWLHYFSTEDPKQFLESYEKLKIADTLENKSPADVYQTSLIDGYIPLQIWIDGNSIVGKNVLEVGCGPGFLGKQLGMVTAQYLGLDHSKLALYIARLTSPPNCTYLHMSETERIRSFAGRMDTMVSRFFFIHQNYDNALLVLKLASILLKAGGVLSADFFLENPSVAQGIVYPAKHELDPRYPSCGFQFTVEEIETLAHDTGFKVERIVDKLNIRTRFVFFSKCSNGIA